MGGDAATPTHDILPSAVYSLSCVISFLSGVSTSWPWYEAHFGNGKCTNGIRNVMRMETLEVTRGSSVRGDRESGSVRGDRESGSVRVDRGSGSVRGDRGSGSCDYRASRSCG